MNMMSQTEIADLLFLLLRDTRTYRDVRLPIFANAGEQIRYGAGLFHELPRPEQIEIAILFEEITSSVLATRMTASQSTHEAPRTLQ